MQKTLGDEWDDERDMNNIIIRSPSIEGKMVIKLKIPNLPPPSQEEVIGVLSTTRVRTVEEEKRVCLECKKEFSSAKALGGHMRVHVHVRSVNKNPSFLKAAKGLKFNNGGCNLKEQQHNKKPYYMKSVNDEGKPTCSQCGKSFPSMKSLFGHMRCHPERVWRGILPPPDTSTANARRRTVAEVGSKIDDDVGTGGGDQVVDLTKFLRGWSVTERRGRKALKKAEDDEGLLEAVEDLMSLANGGGSMAESGVTQRQMKVEYLTEGSNSDSVTIRDNKIDDHSPSINLYGIEKGKAVMVEEIDGKPPENLEVEDEGMITDEQLLIGYNCKKIKRRKKMKLMMELEQNTGATVVTGGSTPSPLTECKYKCTTCNKSFTTHHALGGHRSSHNKSKVTSTDDHQTKEDDYESFLMNQSGDNSVKEFEFEGASSSNNSSVHQCKICDKSFATGQALGGHKRCHWHGPTGADAPASQITSTGEEGSPPESGRKVIDFDLNETPMEEDEVEDEGAADVYGYASSSYNSNMV